MKITIDVSQIVYGTGVSLYTQNLVKNLVELDRNNNYLLFGTSWGRKNELKKAIRELAINSRVKSRLLPIPLSLWETYWNKVHFGNIETFTGKTDIFHSSDWVEPHANCVKITTVHDLSPILFPMYTSKFVRDVHKRKLDWVRKESEIVISPSVSTKSDLISFGIQEEKIRVIPEAPTISMQKFTKQESDEILGKYNIDGEFIISIGTNPRKNISRMVEAFQKVKRKTHLKHFLIVGVDAVDVGLKNDGVITTGYISDKELACLMRLSRMLLYASLYEGFGIPILDSFKIGIPVVTSNTSSMPEVSGDAAVLVDPYDINSISEGIIKAYNDQKKLIALGQERLKLFSWKNTALNTLKVYKEVV